jgi:hypothetical protein
VEAQQPDPDEHIKALAGPLYQRMIEDRDFCLRQLEATDVRVALAAVCLCTDHWKIGSTDAVTEACCRIAASLRTDRRKIGSTDAVTEACFRIAAANTEEAHRFGALLMLSLLHAGTRDPRVCRFLGRLIFDSASTMRLRRFAYWVLIDVAIDRDSESLDCAGVRVLKQICYRHPDHFREDELRERFGFSRELWDSVDQINWGWVVDVMDSLPSEKNE